MHCLPVVGAACGQVEPLNLGFCLRGVSTATDTIDVTAFISPWHCFNDSGSTNDLNKVIELSYWWTEIANTSPQKYLLLGVKNWLLWVVRQWLPVFYWIGHRFAILLGGVRWTVP